MRVPRAQSDKYSTRRYGPGKMRKNERFELGID
jgi:hypothetical protein